MFKQKLVIEKLSSGDHRVRIVKWYDFISGRGYMCLSGNSKFRWGPNEIGTLSDYYQENCLGTEKQCRIAIQKYITNKKKFFKNDTVVKIIDVIYV